MQILQNSRRNFLSSMALFSAGIALKPAIKNLPDIVTCDDDLQKKWQSFWKIYGGEKYNALADLQKQSNLPDTKGHCYRNGDAIFFPKENIIALPVWIYWENNTLHPVDVVITLIEKNSLKKIGRMNRFETDALYKTSKKFYEDNLLTAFCNNLKPGAPDQFSLLKNKISIAKDSYRQQVSYYKERSLIFHKKFIYHS